METIKHIAIIMDGNGRWAKSQGLPRTRGHLSGVYNVRNIAIAANEKGIEVLTVFAFSTENWKRSKEEVDYLMKLPFLFFKKFINELMEKNIRIMMIGEWKDIPIDTAKILKKAIEQTSQNTGMILNFAMNYGSQQEILHAAQQCVLQALAGEITEVTHEIFKSHLYTQDLPDVDLLIRTSGEMRISNFLLYQIAYSELMFVQESWPEFTPERLNECIEQFQTRERRFGGIIK